MITPDQIPQWIPGQVTRDSMPLGWQGITLKGYRYASMGVEIPEMRDFMLVVYKDCISEQSRWQGNKWQVQQIRHGCVSALTRGEPSRWRWSHPIDVSHVYLVHDLVLRTAGEVFDKQISDVGMQDIVGTEDPLLHNLAAMLEQEISEGGFGGHLYVDAIKTQLCIHFLRKYAKIKFKEYNNYGALTPIQCRRISAYIEEHIENNISLPELAELIGMNVYSFMRKFPAHFNTSPHTYVMNRRIERAKKLLACRNIPLKVVAASSGFSDQSHMTRVFRKILNVTPLGYRDSTS